MFEIDRPFYSGSHQSIGMLRCPQCCGVREFVVPPTEDGARRPMDAADIAALPKTEDPKKAKGLVRRKVTEEELANDPWSRRSPSST